MRNVVLPEETPPLARTLWISDLGESYILCNRIVAAIEIDKVDDLYWCFETFIQHMVRFTPRGSEGLEFLHMNQFDYEGIMGQKLMDLAEVGDLLL